jgi:hypothetical protein
VNPLHVDWKDIPQTFYCSDVPVPSTAEVIHKDQKQTKEVENRARRINNERIAMNTGNVYLHMEVRIVKGGNKANLGVVKGSHLSPEGDTLINVLTTTMANNTFSTYPIQNLRERLYVHEQSMHARTDCHLTIAAQV